MNKPNVVTSWDLDNDTIYIDQDNKVKARQGAFDVTGIINKPFERGSAVLALDSNGQLYRFNQAEAYYKDLSLSINASTVGPVEGGTKHRVTLVIENTRETSVDNFEVYFNCRGSVSDVTVNAGNATYNEEASSVDDRTFKFNSIEPFGTARVTFYVTSEDNDYITASVSAPGDVNTDNNSVGASLQRLARVVDLSSCFTADCPEITAEIVGFEGKKLPVFQMSDTVQSRVSLNFERQSTPTPITIINAPNLQGVQVKFQGASSVQCFTQKYKYFDHGGLLLRKPISDSRVKAFFEPYQFYGTGSADYNFDFESQLLTVNGNPNSLLILVRPKSSTCKWQYFYLTSDLMLFTIQKSVTKPVVEGLDQQYYTYQPVRVDSNGSVMWQADGYYVNTARPATEIATLINLLGDNIEDYQHESYYGSHLKDGEKKSEVYGVVIELPAGQHYEFTIRGAQGVNYQQGNVAVTQESHDTIRVVVSEQATATDSITQQLYNNVIIKIV